MRTLFVVLSAAIAIACQSMPSARASMSSSAATPELQQETAVDIAMDTSSGRPQIDVMIRGRALQAIYDTGSQGAIIPRSLADALKLPVIGQALVGSPNGDRPLEVDVVSIDGLEIAGVRIPALDRSLDAVVLDDARLPTGSGLVIGNNQFPGRSIELDFVAGRFRLTPPSSESTHDWAPLNERGLIETRLRIGDEYMPIHIDSGNAGLLDVPESSAERLPLIGPMRAGAAISQVNRRMATTLADMDTDATLGDQPIHLKGAFRFAPIRFANLGGRGLKGARLRIDMAQKRWQLRFEGQGIPVIGEAVAQGLSK